MDGVGVSTEDEWCDYGDMPKVMCEHCITGKKTAGTNIGGIQARDTGFRGPIGLDKPKGDRPVPATYNGLCPECTEPIKKDFHWIVRGSDGWIHEGCAE
jgi:hypothetical protein